MYYKLNLIIANGVIDRNNMPFDVDVLPNLSFQVGLPVIFDADIYDANGVPYTFSAYTMTLAFSHQLQTTPLFTRTSYYVAGKPTNTARIEIVRESTAQLMPGRYWCDISTTISGSRYVLLAPTICNLLPNVAYPV